MSYQKLVVSLLYVIPFCHLFFWGGEERMRMCISISLPSRGQREKQDTKEWWEQMCPLPQYFLHGSLIISRFTNKMTIVCIFCFLCSNVFQGTNCASSPTRCHPSAFSITTGYKQPLDTAFSFFLDYWLHFKWSACLHYAFTENQKRINQISSCSAVFPLKTQENQS